MITKKKTIKKVVKKKVAKKIVKKAAPFFSFPIIRKTPVINSRYGKIIAGKFIITIGSIS